MLTAGPRRTPGRRRPPADQFGRRHAELAQQFSSGAGGRPDQLLRHAQADGRPSADWWIEEKFLRIRHRRCNRSRPPAAPGHAAGLDFAAKAVVDHLIKALTADVAINATLRPGSSDRTNRTLAIDKNVQDVAP